MPQGSSDHFWRIGTVKAAVLPVPVLEPPIQSLPFNISGMLAFWIPVGFFISIDASEATSHGATPIEAKSVFSRVASGNEGSPDDISTGNSLGFFALIREVVATGGSSAWGGDSFLLLREPAWFSESVMVTSWYATACFGVVS
jgi:hypothetical protein